MINYLISAIEEIYSDEKGYKDYKKYLADQYVRYNINRIIGMTEYKNLPDTIQKKFLELHIQTKGHAGFVMVNDKLYVMQCGLGGEPDYNSMPTIATFTNVGLNFSGTRTIGKDCEIIYNDSLGIGMLPMLSRYANLMADNMITLKMADIWSRVTALISADDESARKSGEQYLKKLKDGGLMVAATSTFLDGIKAQPLSQGATSALTDIIEVQQYLKGSLYNEIGLNANFNMKREAIMGDEAEMNQDSLSTLVDNMLNERKEGIDRVNKLFGTKIEVELGGAWKQREEMEELTIDQIKTNVDAEYTSEESNKNEEIEESEEQSDDNKSEQNKEQD